MQTRLWLIPVLCVAGLLVIGAGCDREDPIPVTPPPDQMPGTGAPTRPATTSSTPPVVQDEDPTAQDIRGEVQPDPRLAKLIQTLAVFDHPKACTPSADGQFLFVTNTGYNGTGYTPGKGCISKLKIDAMGRLTMVKREFTDGLTAPMGIAYLTKATKKFAAGTLFVCTGMTAQTDKEGNFIDDINKCNPGVTVIDPGDGKIIGFIPLGPKSAAFKVMQRGRDHQIVAPNGITFDHEGTLYIGDMGMTGKNLNPQVVGRPGIIRIPAPAIDAYSENRMMGMLVFQEVRHAPNGIYHCGLDDFMYWATCDGDGPAGGAVYRMSRTHFGDTTYVSNVLGFAEGGGTLEGVTITPIRGQMNAQNRWGGTMIVSRTNGDLMYMMKEKLDAMLFLGDDQPTFSMPGDLKLFLLPANKWGVLYVPERDESSEKPNKQKLRVILMPFLM